MVPRCTATKTRLSSAGEAKVNLFQVSGTVALLTGGTIAQGSFGKVRIGVDLRSNKAVAIKEFGHRDSLARDPRDFEQEVVLLEMFSFGLNFVGSYARRDKPRWGYMMTCMDGCINEVKRFETFRAPHIRMDVVRNTGAQISAELAHLHAAGFLHGDVKPHNILFNADGLICLGDHGALVPLGEDGTAPHGAVGCTIASPEFFAGGLGTKALDVFCLGFALWKLYVPENHFYGIGDGPPHYLMPAEHALWLDWAETRSAPHTATANVQAAIRCWEEFERLDKVVADFVFNSMLKTQLPAQQVADFFNRPDIRVTNSRIEAHLQRYAISLPTFQERQRLHDAVQNFWGMAPRLAPPAAAFAEQHFALSRQQVAPAAASVACASYSISTQVEVSTQVGAVVLVRIPASRRYYLTTADDAVAHGTRSLWKVALYKELNQPTMVREFGSRPVVAPLPLGATHRMAPMQWDEHDSEMELRDTLGMDYHMTAAHRLTAPEERVRQVQQACTCNLFEVATTAPAAIRLRFAYRMLDEGSAALAGLHDAGRAHARLDLTHLLHRSDGPLALAGLSGTVPLGERADLSSLYRGTFLAPELLWQGPYSAQSDMWALGATIWQMAVADKPLEGLHLRGGEDLFAMLQEVQAFELWRAWTLCSTAPAPLLPHRDRPRRYTKAWRAFTALDAPLADFVLNEMLCPVGQRCTPREAIDFARARIQQTATTLDYRDLFPYAQSLPTARAHARLLAAKRELLGKHPGARTLLDVMEAELGAQALSPAAPRAS